MVEYVRSTYHTNDLDSTNVVANVEYRIRRLIREAIEIEKQSSNLVTWDDPQCLPTTWKQVLNRIKKKILRTGALPLTAEITRQHDENRRSRTDVPVPKPGPITHELFRNQPKGNDESKYKLGLETRDIGLLQVTTTGQEQEIRINIKLEVADVSLPKRRHKERKKPTREGTRQKRIPTWIYIYLDLYIYITYNHW